MTPPLPATSREIIAVIILWRHGGFDTVDIGALLGLEESEVARVLHAIRGTRRRRERLAARRIMERAGTATA